MRKIVLTFGLIAGAILSAMLVGTMPFAEQIGFDRGAVIGYTTMVLAFLLIFFGVRSYRDTVGGGTVRFGRAFAVGGLIAVVASTCYVATWEVIYFNAAPEYMTKYQAHILEKARQSGETEAQLAARKAEMDRFAVMYQNPIINAGITFLEPLPVALVVALVSAGVLSRRKADLSDTGAPLGDVRRST
jgi:hypothetical protein